MLQNKCIPVIVSKKNKQSIEYRLKQYGLNIPAGQVYGKDELTKYKTKPDFIAEYMVKNSIKIAYFVDDNSNNLTPCKIYPQIVPLLAGWGNIAIGETGLDNQEIVSAIFD